MSPAVTQRFSRGFWQTPFFSPFAGTVPQCDFFLRRFFFHRSFLLLYGESHPYTLQAEPLCRSDVSKFGGFFSDLYICVYIFYRTTFFFWVFGWFFLLDPVDLHTLYEHYTQLAEFSRSPRRRHMWGKITFLFCSFFFLVGILSKQKCSTHRFFHGSCHYRNCYYWWTFWKHINVYKKKKCLKTVNIYTIAAFVRRLI